MDAFAKVEPDASPKSKPLNVVENGNDVGSPAASQFVPMGYFTVTGPGKEKPRKFLKSTGYASCIGLVMLSPDGTAGVLAHFMSDNEIPTSINLIVEALGNAGARVDAGWSAVVFLGKPSESKHKDSATAEKSAKLAGKRALGVVAAMKKLGVAEPRYVDTGFKSVAVDVGERMVQLFDAAPEATLPGSAKAAWALMNKPLTEI